jgi:hypothetical protein
MSTNWLLNGLAEANGKQELYARQSRQVAQNPARNSAEAKGSSFQGIRTSPSAPSRGCARCGDVTGRIKRDHSGSKVVPLDPTGETARAAFARVS